MISISKKMMVAVSSLILFAACKNNESKTPTTDTAKAVESSVWGSYENKPVHLFRLNNGHGSVITVSDYGGTITGWTFPDINGDTSQIIIGFDSLSGYLAHPPYFGALIGRYGNRIAKGKFTLDGKAYQLAVNDGNNHLHGGLKGFDKVLWNVQVPDSNKAELVLHYLSKDGEENYPGNLDVTVHYLLDSLNQLHITYDADADKVTPVNLTNHTYFNLSGDLSKTVLNEKLMLSADGYTPVQDQIPTGKIVPVKGTPFDFTQPFAIGARINEVTGGYDHNFALNTNGDINKVAVTLSDSSTGRTLTVYTTQPGIQFYSGNFLDGSMETRGEKIVKYAGLCLETQHFPDSPNEPDFPTTIVKPGEHYHQEAIYKIGLNK